MNVRTSIHGLDRVEIRKTSFGGEVAAFKREDDRWTQVGRVEIHGRVTLDDFNNSYIRNGEQLNSHSNLMQMGIVKVYHDATVSVDASTWVDIEVDDQDVAELFLNNKDCDIVSIGFELRCECCGQVIE